MKRILMLILIASIVSPTFAFADNDKSERKGENKNNSQKSVQMAQKNEKKELKNEVKSIKKDNDHDDDDKKYRLATTTATATLIQTAKKTNYFLCKTDSGWNVVPFEGVKNKNSNNALGKYCMKLPHGFTKKFYGKTVTSTPDAITPIISGLSASFVTTTSAIVSWTTNEIANGNIYISTSTPMNLASSTTLGSVALSTAHSFSLSSLTAGTTYYYVVKSADLAGNVSTSTEQSFVTPAVADTTAPVISSIITSPVASTTATVSWNTNELATGKLWYGTSTPLTLYMQSTTPSLALLFNLIGLTASSTTYSLLIESADVSNNIATSTASLTTTN